MTDEIDNDSVDFHEAMRAERAKDRDRADRQQALAHAVDLAQARGVGGSASAANAIVLDAQEFYNFLVGAGSADAAS